MKKTFITMLAALASFAMAQDAPATPPTPPTPVVVKGTCVVIRDSARPRATQCPMKQHVEKIAIKLQEGNCDPEKAKEIMEVVGEIIKTKNPHHTAPAPGCCPKPAPGCCPKPAPEPAPAPAA
ncbi:MAG: hypothetical protein ACI4PY_04950 [Akkermansia muciniphila]